MVGFSTRFTTVASPERTTRPSGDQTPTWRPGAKTAGRQIRRCSRQYPFSMNPFRKSLWRRRWPRDLCIRRSGRLLTLLRKGLRRHSPPPSKRGTRPGHGPGSGSDATSVHQSVGFIAKDLSPNGEHLIFGSTAKFAPGGNDGTGDVSIYDHNLRSGETHALSKTPGGAAMAGAGIAELDISNDGSRVLLGQVVSEEGGVNHWKLYMNIRDSEQTLDLTPGASDGVLYDGMTSDGSTVSSRQPTNWPLPTIRILITAPISTRRKLKKGNGRGQLRAYLHRGCWHW